MTSKMQSLDTIKTFSAYKIDNDIEFEFSPSEYSKFKFGANNYAKKFGHILADKFIARHLAEHYDGTPMYVLPSAYSHIPTPSFYMSVHFVDKLNHYLFQKDFAPVQIGKIDRSVTYREDYGGMSAEQRYDLIRNDEFYFDKIRSENKILVFIDDIKITGTHERMFLELLDKQFVDNRCFMLYFAELVNPKVSPKIENYFNHYFVKTIFDLDYIIKNEDFVFNTRVVKYILNSEHPDCVAFLKLQTNEFVEQLFYLAVGNEYFKFKEYQSNFKYLEKIITKQIF